MNTLANILLWLILVAAVVSGYVMYSYIDTDNSMRLSNEPVHGDEVIKYEDGSIFVPSSGESYCTPNAQCDNNVITEPGAVEQAKQALIKASEVMK